MPERFFEDLDKHIFKCIQKNEDVWIASRAWSGVCCPWNNLKNFKEAFFQIWMHICKAMVIFKNCNVVLVNEQIKIFGGINNWENIFTTSKTDGGFIYRNLAHQKWVTGSRQDPKASLRWEPQNLRSACSTGQALTWEARPEIHQERKEGIVRWLVICTEWKYHYTEYHITVKKTGAQRDLVTRPKSQQAGAEH